MVQRRSARFVTNRYRNRSSVTDMLEQLKWTPFEDRRKNACYKRSDTRRSTLQQVTNSYHLTGSQEIRAQNSFQIPQCNTTTRKESFYPRTIRDWNTLLSSVTSVGSLESFKRLLTNKKINSSLFLNHHF